MTDIGNAKYMIRVSVKLDGQGQRKDIIGAIFGQTEGLMPEALDLRKLQRSGRIGHIDVTLESKKGKVSGIIEIPSTLENVESAIIGAALDNFGRLDILIHNAGNVRRSPLAQMSYHDFDAVLDVHLRGAFHVVREAFPQMCSNDYGRIVLTSSIGGLYGNNEVANYGVAKAGIIGLSNVAAIEGAPSNVKCNVIVPAAVTRMADGLDTSAYPPMGADLVAPAVGWLAHESCSITGEMLVAIAGRIARAYIAETPGVYRPSWTIEDVESHVAQIRDTAGSVVFPAAPDGHAEHIRYSFGMAARGVTHG